MDRSDNAIVNTQKTCKNPKKSFLNFTYMEIKKFNKINQMALIIETSYFHIS